MSLRLRKLEGGVAGRGSLELGRLVAREERLLQQAIEVRHSGPPHIKLRLNFRI